MKIKTFIHSLTAIGVHRGITYKDDVAYGNEEDNIINAFMSQVKVISVQTEPVIYWAHNNGGINGTLIITRVLYEQSLVAEEVE